MRTPPPKRGAIKQPTSHIFAIRRCLWAAQVLEGFRRQTAEIGRLALPGMWKSYARAGQWLNLDTIVYLLTAMVTAVGWWKLARATADPLALTFPIYVAFFVCWPFDQGTRFTAPMLPVLAAGAWYLLTPIRVHRDRLFTLLILAHLLVSLGAFVRQRARVRRENQQWPAMQLIAQRLPLDRGLIVAHGVSQTQWLFLCFLTDQRILWQENPEVIPPQTQTVVSPESQPDQPGFQTAATMDGFKIQQRRLAD